LESTQSAPVPARRIILLGASNVTLAFPVILDIARGICGRPLEVLAAFGHGRSYGERHALLWRELPGIIECGLWQALRQLPPAPTAALVTDIGNDLLYEVPVPQILGWVETCLDRLQGAGAATVLTPLPLAGALALSPAKYLLLRTVLYPACRLPFRTMRDRAVDLDERLRWLGSKRQVFLAEPRPEWYGFDRIHIRPTCWRTAWQQILALWSTCSALANTTAEPLSLCDRIALRGLAPERRWLFRREQSTPQPAGRLPDGSTISLY
jgi:hypothetical protein